MKPNDTAPGGCVRRWLLVFVMVAALLPLIATTAAEDDAPSVSDHWNVIDAYNDATQAYWTKQSEIRNADVSAEEKERRQQDLGPAPDVAPAVAAATAIVESNGERSLDAAEFLLNRTLPTGEWQQLAFDAVVAHIGPDWSLVRDYVESQSVWLEAAQAESRDEAARRLLQLGVEPPTLHAVAAARAIVESGHERAIDAAEFLMDQTYAVGRGGAAMFSWWLRPSAELGEAALVELIGPDWTVVRDYVDESNSR